MAGSAFFTREWSAHGRARPEIFLENADEPKYDKHAHGYAEEPENDWHDGSPIDPSFKL